MPNMDGWLSGEGQPDAIAEIIGYKSVSTGDISRGGSTVAAKTIRLETLSNQRQVQGPNGITYIIDAFALAELDTDLRVGDRFTVDGQTFEVEMVLPGHVDCEQYYLRLRR